MSSNRFSIASVLLAMFWIFSAGSSAMFAQDRQDRFRTKEECLAASEGAFKYYQPSFMTLRREPRSGEEVRELESEACVWMKVVADATTPSGRAWVRQEKGTRAIYRGTVPVARYDCGNPIYEVAYVPPRVVAVAPAPPPAEPEPEPEPEPTSPPAPVAPNVTVNVTVVPTPVIVWQAPRREEPRPQARPRRKWPWVVAGLAAAGAVAGGVIATRGRDRPAPGVGKPGQPVCPGCL